MSIFAAYKTSSKSENEGVRIVKGSNEDGTEIAFYVARNGKTNTSFKLAQERAFKPHRAALKGGTMSDEQATTLLLDLFCGYLLKGWENVYDESEKAIPFSIENAKALMIALPDLYEELTEASNDMSLFLDSNRESDAKN